MPSSATEPPMGPDPDQVLVGKRILVVDDEPDILESVADVLMDSIVETAGTFEEAVKRLTGSSYDVAILDIMGVRGLDLLAEFGAKLPCVMLTGKALGTAGKTVGNAAKRRQSCSVAHSRISMINRCSGVAPGSRTLFRISQAETDRDVASWSASGGFHRNMLLG